MVKLPKIVSNEDLIAMSAKEDMAKGTIGATAISLLREGRRVTWTNIVSRLDHEATSSGDMLAKGALRFIATLPSEPAG